MGSWNSDVAMQHVVQSAAPGCAQICSLVWRPNEHTIFREETWSLTEFRMLYNCVAKYAIDYVVESTMCHNFLNFFRGGCSACLLWRESLVMMILMTTLVPGILLLPWIMVAAKLLLHTMGGYPQFVEVPLCGSLVSFLWSCSTWRYLWTLRWLVG